MLFLLPGLTASTCSKSNFTRTSTAASLSAARSLPKQSNEVKLFLENLLRLCKLGSDR